MTKHVLLTLQQRFLILSYDLQQVSQLNKESLYGNLFCPPCRFLQHYIYNNNNCYNGSVKSNKKLSDSSSCTTAFQKSRFKIVLSYSFETVTNSCGVFQRSILLQGFRVVAHLHSLLEKFVVGRSIGHSIIFLSMLLYSVHWFCCVDDPRPTACICNKKFDEAIIGAAHRQPATGPLLFKMHPTQWEMDWWLGRKRRCGGLNGLPSPFKGRTGWCSILSVVAISAEGLRAKTRQ